MEPMAEGVLDTGSLAEDESRNYSMAITPQGHTVVVKNPTAVLPSEEDGEKVYTDLDASSKTTGRWLRAQQSGSHNTHDTPDMWEVSHSIYNYQCTYSQPLDGTLIPKQEPPEEAPDSAQQEYSESAVENLKEMEAVVLETLQTLSNNVVVQQASDTVISKVEPVEAEEGEATTQMEPVSHQTSEPSQTEGTYSNIGGASALLRSVLTEAQQLEPAQLANIMQQKNSSSHLQWILPKTETPGSSSNNKTEDKWCGVCGKGFTTVVDLRSHQRMHEGVTPRKPFQCDVCYKSFSLRVGLKRHMVSQHGPDSIVGRDFSDNGSKDVGEGSSTKYFECEECNAKFSELDNLANHKKMKHNAKKLYPCDICNASFTAKSSLKVHKMSHAGKKPHKCDICGKGFLRGDGLRIHKLRHSGVKNFKCGDCDKKFVTNTELTAHQVSHGHGGGGSSSTSSTATTASAATTVAGAASNASTPVENPLGGQVKAKAKRGRKPKIKVEGPPNQEEKKSPVVVVIGPKIPVMVRPEGKIELPPDIQNYLVKANAPSITPTPATPSKSTDIDFSQLQTLPGPCSCRFCGRACHNRSALEVHERSHTGEKPFTCEVCQKSFSSSSGLYRHERTHSTERPYECRFCGKRFLMEIYLKRHETNHTGDRPYECNICHKRFIFASHLTRHMTTHKEGGRKSFDGEEKKDSDSDGSSSHSSDDGDDDEIMFATKAPALPPPPPPQVIVPKFSCSYCNKHFQHKSVYEIHLRTHTGERPFACNICTRTFSSKSILVRHIKTHDNLKRFSCDLCGQRFLEMVAMRRHVWRHTLDKSCQCDACDKAFVSDKLLERHKRKAHPVRRTEPVPIRMKEAEPIVIVKNMPDMPAAAALSLFSGMCLPDPASKNLPQEQAGLTEKEKRKMLRKAKKEARLERKKIKKEREIAASVSKVCYVCEDCGKTCYSVQELQEHKHTVHMGPPAPETSVTVKEEEGGVEQADVMQSYLKNAMPKDETPPAAYNVRKGPPKKINRCDICGKTFTRRLGLLRHNLIHTGERPYECQTCGKKFTQSSGLTQHRRAIHGEKPSSDRPPAPPKVFMCEICGKYFNNKTKLRVHKVTHTEAKPFKCDVCGKCYSHPGVLYRHKDIHRNKTFACKVCGKTFVKYDQLKHHKKKHFWETHGKELSYTCEVCGKGFYRSTELCKHLLLHTGNHPGMLDYYTCEICRRRFISSLGLKLHMRKHASDNPHVCGVCGKLFNTVVDLNRHMRIHTGEKLHECDICGRGFASRGNLIKHSRLHEEELSFKNPHDGLGPFVCELCGQSFNLSSDLELHRQAHLTTGTLFRTHSGHTLEPGAETTSFLESHRAARQLVYLETGDSYEEVEEAMLEEIAASCLESFSQVAAANYASQTGQAQYEYVSHNMRGEPVDGRAATTYTAYSDAGPAQYEVTVWTANSEEKIEEIHEIHGDMEQAMQGGLEEAGLDHAGLEGQVYQTEDDPMVVDYSHSHGGVVVPQQLYTVTASDPNNEVVQACTEEGTTIVISAQDAEHAKQIAEMEGATIVMEDGNGEKVVILSTQLDNGEQEQVEVQLAQHDNTTVEEEQQQQQQQPTLPENEALDLTTTTNTNNKGAFMCDRCGKCFARQPNLIVHKRQHTGERPFQCNVCGKKFAAKNQLKIHSLNHTGEKRFSCEFCGKKFSTRGPMLEHQRIHTGEKPYQCGKCGKCFSHSSDFSRHRDAHSTRKTYACNVCGLAFIKYDALRYHKKRHIYEIRGKHKSHTCEICGKAFYRSTELNKHRLVHSGMVDLQHCQVCSKKFATLAGLKLHMIKKHGNMVSKLTPPIVTVAHSSSSSTITPQVAAVVDNTAVLDVKSESLNDVALDASSSATSVGVPHVVQVDDPAIVPQEALDLARQVESTAMSQEVETTALSQEVLDLAKEAETTAILAEALNVVKQVEPAAILEQAMDLAKQSHAPVVEAVGDAQQVDQVTEQASIFEKEQVPLSDQSLHTVKSGEVKEGAELVGQVTEQAIIFEEQVPLSDQSLLTLKPGEVKEGAELVGQTVKSEIEQVQFSDQSMLAAKPEEIMIAMQHREQALTSEEHLSG